MPNIDYSKWDKLEYSDDEHQQQQEEEERSYPQVTKLDQPSTIHAENGTLSVMPQQQEREEDDDSTTVATKTKDNAVIRTSSNDKKKEWTTKGGRVEHEGRTVWWSQDRYTVTFRMAAPTVVGTVRVPGIVPYAQRFTASTSTTNNSNTLSIKIHGGETKAQKESVWFRGTLPHPVHLNQDEDEDIDWAVETTNNDRVLIICLAKATPVEGMTLWWKRPLCECPETYTPDTSSRFQESWAEAHRQFREKMKEKGNRG